MDDKSRFITCLIFLLILKRIYSVPTIDDIDIKEIYNFLLNYDYIQVLNDIDSSKYFYFQNLNDISKLEYKMPNINFTECLNKIKDNNNISNLNEIYIFILELNDQRFINGKLNFLTNSINTTFFRFFTKNIFFEGFLNYSICNNMEIKVSKRVETSKINYQEIKEIEKKYNISVFRNSSNFIDYCSPLNINNKDLTLYDRQILLFKNEKPCDNGCTFLNFNYTTNYSSCLCKILDEDNKINFLNKINEKIKGNDWIEKFNQLLEKGNLKYFKCYKQALNIKNKNEKHNWIRYIIFILIIIVIILQILYCKSDKNLLSNDENKSKIEELKNKNKIKNENKSTNNNNSIILTTIKREIYQSEDMDENNKKTKNKNIKNMYTIFNNSFISSSKREIHKSAHKDDDSTETKNKNIKNRIIAFNNSLILSKSSEFYKLDNMNVDSKETKSKNYKKKIITLHNPFIITRKNEIHKLDEIETDNIKNNSKDSKENFCKIYSDYLKQKIIFFLLFTKKSQELSSLYFKLIINILSIHNLIFYNAFLFSDKCISKRYYLKQNEIEYILTNEFDRIFLVFCICKIINEIFLFLFETAKENLNKNTIESEKENTKENRIEIESVNDTENEKNINSLKKCYKLNIIIVHSLIILYLY